MSTPARKKIAGKRRGISIAAASATIALAAPMSVVPALAQDTEEVITAPAETQTQRVTHGVKIDGVIVNSNGDNNDGGAELPEALRDLKVTLTNNETGEVFTSGDASTWRGANNYPVVQNFGLADVPLGTYTVGVTGYDDVEDLEIRTESPSTKGSPLFDGATVEIDGKTPNLFVEFVTPEEESEEESELEIEDGPEV